MKKFVLPLLALSILAFAYTETDVSNANYLATKGIITAQSSTAGFRLNDTITRAEAAGIALKIKGVVLPENYQCKKYFSDVTNNDWICRAVEIAADAGLVSRANTKFRPQDNITRAEALAILIKAGGIKILNTNDGAEGELTLMHDFIYSYSEHINWQVNVFYTYINLFGSSLEANYNRSNICSTVEIRPGTERTYCMVDVRLNGNATRAEVFGFAKDIIEYQLALSSTCTIDSPNFTCGPVTQGYEDPNNSAPTVCGCKPTCPVNQFTVVSSDIGYWSDGSAKGVFVCSTDLPS